MFLYAHVAKRTYPLPVELQNVKLDTFFQKFANPITMNAGRAYARASALIAIAHLEDYWEMHISDKDEDFPEFDVRMIHNGAMVIYYDRALHEHRNIVSFVAYPVEQVKSDSMVLYRGYKIYQNASGFYVFDDDHLRITRSDTIDQTFAKIDLALENVPDCAVEDKVLPPQKVDLKKFHVTMESMCDESLQTTICVSAENEGDAINVANDLVSDNEYRAVSAAEYAD